MVNFIFAEFRRVRRNGKFYFRGIPPRSRKWRSFFAGNGGDFFCGISLLVFAEMTAMAEKGGIIRRYILFYLTEKECKK